MIISIFQFTHRLTVLVFLQRMEGIHVLLEGLRKMFVASAEVCMGSILQPPFKKPNDFYYDQSPSNSISHQSGSSPAMKRLSCIGFEIGTKSHYRIIRFQTN